MQFALFDQEINKSHKDGDDLLKNPDHYKIGLKSKLATNLI
jgi:hypothetical protein